MRRFLLATLFLGITVTANGQTVVPSRLANPFGSASMRALLLLSDNNVRHYRNLVLNVDGLEISADDATAPKDGDTFTLTGTVTIKITSKNPAPTVR